MNILKVSAVFLSVSLLAACALTPEQKAAQSKERAQKLLETQISLAQQCDPTAAKLMAQMPTANQLAPAQKKAFEKNYTKRLNNPTFKACYNMAWKTYQEQNQLEIAKMQAWDEANALNWENGMFFNEPFGWGTGPFAWGPY